MRNPFFVEVKMDEKDIFAPRDLNPFSYGATVTSLNMNNMGKDMQSQDINQKINQISELPSGLKNFYTVVDSQKGKL